MGLVGGRLMAVLAAVHELVAVNELIESGMHSFVRLNVRDRLEELGGNWVEVLVGDLIFVELVEYIGVLELVFSEFVELAQLVYVSRMTVHICQVHNYPTAVLSMNQIRTNYEIPNLCAKFY